MWIRSSTEEFNKTLFLFKNNFERLVGDWKWIH
jgi:hypothetical protein